MILTYNATVVQSFVIYLLAARSVAYLGPFVCIRLGLQPRSARTAACKCPDPSTLLRTEGCKPAEAFRHRLRRGGSRSICMAESMIIYRFLFALVFQCR